MPRFALSGRPGPMWPTSLARARNPGSRVHPSRLERWYSNRRPLNLDRPRNFRDEPLSLR
jgi:hypothetical protein